MRTLAVIKPTHLGEIPNYLIAEQLGDILFYYKGYKSVLDGSKTLEEIMACSVLQFTILQYIIRQLVLFDLEEEKFVIGNNEAGLHMGHKKNVANDLAIYDAKKMTSDKIIGKYADFPPEVVVEVDINVESSVRCKQKRKTTTVNFKTTISIEIDSQYFNFTSWN